MSSRPFIRIQNLIHRYEFVIALKGVSFEVREGEIFGLLGPNGGGKSTLFRILSTNLFPTSGEIFYRKWNLLEEPDEIRKRISVIFQNPSIDEKLTVEENLYYHGMLYHLKRHEIKENIARLLDQFGLSERKHAKAEQLSGGMKRKVEIAKGLISNPELVIMDEPGTGLDPGSRDDLWQLIEEINRKNLTTFLITTHIMEEAENCHRVGILESGQLAVVGKPADLKRRVGAEMVEIQSNKCARLMEKLENEYSISPEIIEDTLYFEHDEGHRLLTKIIETSPELVEQISVRNPSMSDVFRLHTGNTYKPYMNGQQAIE